MKRFTILMSALLCMGIAGYSQQHIDMNLVRTLLGKHYPKALREDIRPEKTEYYANEDATVRFRDSFDYDEDEGFLTEKNTYMQDLGEWQLYGKESYTYDYSNRPEEILSQAWDNGWVNSSRLTMTYEGFDSDLLKETLLETWQDGAWQDFEKSIYDYNLTTTILVKEWTGTTWMNHWLYTYETIGNQMVLTLQYWQGGAWQNQEQQRYTLNDNDEVESIIFTLWDNTGWQNVEKHDYEYQGSHPNQIIITPWENGAWSSDHRKAITYTLDAMGNSTRAICEANYGGASNLNADIEMFYGDGMSLLYNNVHEVQAEYSGVSAVDESLDHGISLYPNPACDQVTVRCEHFVKVEVYNLTGQRVAESNSPMISVKGMASGTYLVEVYQSDGPTEVQKMLVR